MEDMERTDVEAMADQARERLIGGLEPPGRHMDKVFSALGMTLTLVGDPDMEAVIVPDRKGGADAYVPRWKEWHANRMATTTSAALVGHLLMHLSTGYRPDWDKVTEPVFLPRSDRDWDDPLFRARIRTVWFASRFLMPVDLVRRYMVDTTVTPGSRRTFPLFRKEKFDIVTTRPVGVEEMAIRMWVSEWALRARMAVLGLREEHDAVWRKGTFSMKIVPSGKQAVL